MSWIPFEEFGLYFNSEGNFKGRKIEMGLTWYFNIKRIILADVWRMVQRKTRMDSWMLVNIRMMLTQLSYMIIKMERNLMLGEAGQSDFSFMQLNVYASPWSREHWKRLLIGREDCEFHLEILSLRYLRDIQVEKSSRRLLYLGWPHVPVCIIWVYVCCSTLIIHSAFFHSQN